MHAADVVEALPTARPDDDMLSALRMSWSRRRGGGLLGIVTADRLFELLVARAEGAR